MASGGAGGPAGTIASLTDAELFEEAGRIGDESLASYRAVFGSLEVSAGGYISRDDVGPALRALGLHPTEADVRRLSDEADRARDGRIEFVPFAVVVHRQMTILRSPASMAACFAEFDPEARGYVTVSEFRSIFGTGYGGGAPLDDASIDEMVKHADPEGTGQVYYAPFIDKVFQAYEKAEKARTDMLAQGRKSRAP